jgi:hypothetical protein
MTLWTHSAGNIAQGASQTISFGDSPSVDAFARLRTSDPFTLFDSKQIWDDPDIANNAENFPLFFDNQETSGGGTSTLFDVNRASTTLSVSANTAGKRVRQTRQKFNYQPGKSQLVIITGSIGDAPSGNVTEVGLLDDDNGLFLQDDGGVWNFVVRSSVSGSAVDKATSQDNWSLDSLDGTGPSGIVLDKSKVQIFFFDFEWLGVGRVRFGFFVDGLPVYAHEELNANAITSVYMSNPNLPIRVSIENDGAGAAHSIEQICSTIVSEGGNQPNGIFRSADTGAAAADDIQGTTIGTRYALCGIRLKTAYLSADVREVRFTIIEVSGANNPFLWAIHFNPTLTTGITYADQPNSAIQFGAGIVAGDVLTDNGIILHSGFVSRSTQEVSLELESALRLGALIDGTRDELILSAAPVTTNQDYHASLSWREAW